MKEFMANKKLLVYDDKYESIRGCCTFDPDLRPSVEELVPVASLDITSLGLSQNSALEIASELILQQAVIAEAHLDDETRPENDGINACTFLALTTCDSLLATLQGNGSHSHLSWTDIAAIADNIVRRFPNEDQSP